MKLYKKLDKYTTVSNEIFKYNLSAKAIGLYAYLVSKPDGWEFSRAGISSQIRDGQSSIQSGLKELEKAGFLFRERNRREDGTLGEPTWYITSEPHSEKPMLENPTEEKPTEEKHVQVNTNKSNNLNKVNKGSLNSLTEELVKEIADQYSVSFKAVSDLRDDLVLYCKSKGKSYRDYKAALQTWVRRALKENKIVKQVDTTPKNLPEMSEDRRRENIQLIQELKLQHEGMYK